MMSVAADVDRVAAADDYPYVKSRAAKMLSKGIDDASDTRGESLRQLAGRLGYKSAVVLSHMRTGRLPIPVERAPELAEVIGMPRGDFIIAVMEQRFPNMNVKKELGAHFRDEPLTANEVSPGEHRLLEELAEIAGRPINELPAEHIGVLREIVGDRSPRKRWLSHGEVGLVEVLRRTVPDACRDGINQEQAEKFAECVKNAFASER